MLSVDDSATLFARAHRLDDGLRVRLRLARPGDQRLLIDLLDRLGFTASEIALLDLVRFEPHRRAVICATALIDGNERMLGFGAIDLDSPQETATVIVDKPHEQAVTPLIRQALHARAQVRVAA